MTKGEKISLSLTGKKLSEEHRKKLSEAKKGKIPPCTFTRRKYNGENNPFYGKKHSVNTLDIISKTHKNKHRSVGTEFKKGQFSDELHPFWKGEEAGYTSKHKWIYKKLGKPSICENCGGEETNCKKIHWANLNHLYRRNLNEWKRLCASCHKLYDLGKIKI